MRALLSVANRDGIADFVRDLAALGVELFAPDARHWPLPWLTTRRKLQRSSRPPTGVSVDAGALEPYQLVVVNVEPFAPSAAPARAARRGHRA